MFTSPKVTVEQHYRRLAKYGRLHQIIGLVRGNCTVEGCDKPIKGHGLCNTHYQTFRNYGVHPNEYAEKLKEQNHVCAICGNPETSIYHNIPGKVKKLAIDHDHKSGKIRGLLCWRCNSLLGRVEENPELLQAMINYLNKHKD